MAAQIGPFNNNKIMRNHMKTKGLVCCIEAYEMSLDLKKSAPKVVRNVRKGSQLFHP